MKTGIELIAEERQRQVSAEGWTPEHDDKHDEQELLIAANCYMLPVRFPAREFMREAPITWPWEREWWKPNLDPIRNLVKAGALIAAEIDRLQRRNPNDRT